MTYHESASGLMIPAAANTALSESAQTTVQLAIMEATIHDLRLQIHEAGWLRLDESGAVEFSREDLGKIVAWSRAAYLKNPLIRRGVEVAALYVFGQDLSVNAEDDGVQAVIDRFWRDNASTLTGQQASRLLEVEREVTANVFLALFPDRATGQVRVRNVPMEEVKRIVCNPEDRAEVWYYERQWHERPIDGGQAVQRKALYPDWRYAPATKPESVSGQDGATLEVRWDSPLCHVKAGAFPHWRWGVPEVYAALDWARAYKEQLEDDATRSRALARFAWRMTTNGGQNGVAAAKTRLGTTLGVGLGGETNPPPVAGSAFIADKSVGLDPIRIAGSTLDPDHSRPARLMASAALGIPDHFFDADVGNYATASTMDRPTELRFSEIRQMWRDVLRELVQYVIDADLAASGGLLRGMRPTDEQREVDLAWPDLLEEDVTERVDAINTAAPYLSDELTARLMMVALGVEDVDGELAKVQAEQAAKAERAEQMAKQTQRLPEEPTPTEAQESAVTITDADLADAQAWWDSRFPELKGILDGKPEDEDE